MKKQFRAIFLLWSFLVANQVSASATWKQLMKSNDLNPIHHGFCFTDSKNQILGDNQHRRVRLASVSKLITTLWFIDEMGPTFQYQTKFFYEPVSKSLHIKGDKDFVFSRRKLFYLVNQLNELGISEIEKLTFDSNVIVYSRAEDYIGRLVQLNQVTTAKNLYDFLHTPEWNKLLPVYDQFYRNSTEEQKSLHGLKPRQELSLSIKEVEFNESPEFLKQPTYTEYTLWSPWVESYLKFMNIKSNNFFADQAFEQLGGEKAFDQYIQSFLDEKFPEYESQRVAFFEGEASIKMYTGSGLNTTRKGSRVDNYASCAITIRLIEKLDQKMTEFGHQIQNIVAVPGVDGGTFRARLNSPRVAKKVIAKTGTLFHTSALAGSINTQNGPRYFGIFHQLQGSKYVAKLIQNEMVRTLLRQNNEGEKFEYQPSAFFPADGMMK